MLDVKNIPTFRVSRFKKSETYMVFSISSPGKGKPDGEFGAVYNIADDTWHVGIPFGDASKGDMWLPLPPTLNEVIIAICNHVIWMDGND